MPYHIDHSPILPTMAPCAGVFAGLGQWSTAIGAIIGSATTLTTTLLMLDQKHRANIQDRHDVERAAAREAELLAAQAKVIREAQEAARVQGAITHGTPSTTGGILAGGQQIASALGSGSGLLVAGGLGVVALLLLMRRRS